MPTSPRFLRMALLGAVAAALSATPPIVRAADEPSGEVRGLWVLRSSLVSPASIAAMVGAATRSGFNTLLVQVRGRGEAFYRSDLEPRASELEEQPDSFDPLSLTIEQAHRAGLRVHAWVNVNLVASSATLPRSRSHVALVHPEWLMAPRALAQTLRATDPHSPGYVGALARWTRGESERVEGLYLSPLVPDAERHTVAVVRELADRYALDGIHLDYIRYPGAEFDYGPLALDQFRIDQRARVSPIERARLDRAAISDPLAWTSAYPEAWTAFRQQRLTGLLTAIRNAVQLVRPALHVSAAVVPNAETARRDKLQDWAAWATSGLLDAVCPMIYTTDETEFAATLNELHGTLGSVPMWAGIGAYRLTASRAAANVRLARKAGAAGVLLFSYDSVTGPSALTPDYLAALRLVMLEPPAGGADRR